MPHATTRPVLSVSSRRRIEASKQKPGQKPKKEDGSNRRKLEQHEAALIPSIRAGRPITIVLIDGDRLIDVTPIGFDRYTIGVEYDGFRETVFKSAIARIIFSEE
ncbi:hypothetical protein TW86_04100 [Halomonas sp. S2151]|uniref:RNA chaperone Hfq n=1 Tax=Halomonas sp. S2151 TaxID=579478 RepID=UPI0005FA45C5|nr:RNA chaperone Hfq [Halomonas sp. S2151]KJZ17442.1 hypothetical protein TW86_04100 [Halomonas sp. S2151]